MMAHAIDIARADDRPTIRSRSARAIGTWSGGCGPPRARHSAAGGWLQLRHDRHDDRMQLADDRLVEATIREGRTGRIGGASSRFETDRPDAGHRSAHHDVDASPTTRTARRTGPRDRSAASWACSTRLSRARGSMPACSRIDASGICARPIPSSRRRPRT